MFMRIAMLLVAWIVGLTEPLLTVLDRGVTGRDLILIGGGLFLLWKSTGKIHQLLEDRTGHRTSAVTVTFGAIITQIIAIDLVFSLDSSITAVGMVSDVEIMIAAAATSTSRWPSR